MIEAKTTIFTQEDSENNKHPKFILEIEENLLNGIFQLPSKLEYTFAPFTVYRKVKINKTKLSLDATDFYCQMEMLGHNIAIPRPVQTENFEEYGCSFFTELQALYDVFSKSSRFRKRNLYVAVGILCSDFGAVYRCDAPHIMLFKYEGVTLASFFKLYMED